MKKKSKRNISYSSSFKFIKESRNYIYSILALFIISSLIGYFFPIFFVEEITNIFLELANLFTDLGPTETIFMIMGNNIRAGLISLIAGIILGIMPVISAIFNGYLVGFVASIVVPEFGFGVLWRLLPHGIFELPAIFISMGLGLKLGLELLDKRKDTKRNFQESIKVFVLIVIPFLVIAAIIEGILIFSGI